MKAIIFGISGQDGFYLNELLIKNGIEVIGVSRSADNGVQGDISDSLFVNSIVREYRPSYIFHFAANSTTKHEALFENHAAISTGTLNVLEAVYRSGIDCRVFISGSALQFLNNSKPISEDTPFEGRDIYSVSRIHSVYLARYYRRQGVKVYVGYFFHHDSPRRSDKHLNMKIVRAAKELYSEGSQGLTIGDVSVIKEFNFARDLVAAVWRLVNQDEIYEAVIGSGKGYKIEDWLSICFNLMGKDWHDYVKIKAEYVPDFRYLVSKPDVIKRLGWDSLVSIESLAELMIYGDLRL